MVENFLKKKSSSNNLVSRKKFVAKEIRLGLLVGFPKH